LAKEFIQLLISFQSKMFNKALQGTNLLSELLSCHAGCHAGTLAPY